MDAITLFAGAGGADIGSNATFKQAGNAVAPIMAEVLARSLPQQDTQ